MDTATDDELVIGVDLGTSRSAISASNGKKKWVESYVGWPKDFIARKVVGKPVVFGEDALDHRLSVELFRPLESGVVKEGERDRQAVRALIQHLIDLVGPRSETRVRAVIGVPAESFRSNQLAIKDAVADYVSASMVVSEPFAVAYGLNMLDNTLIIDIGAGTMDFCIMHGSMPGEEDQRTVATAGDWIDQQLLSFVRERYPAADINLNMARHFKEEHSFVGKPSSRVEVMIPVDGRPTAHDITAEMRRACEGILPALVETTLEMIARFDPEYQDQIRGNVVLAGGGSLIRGLHTHLQERLAEYGPAQVTCVPDPLYSGAAGAMSLACDMPDEYWNAL
ncbi:MAG: rod shape-determining protein [Defluviicoccus sp.]|nr:MAG: rod shape-determining protein [Defluviicoccus sp.]